MKLNEGIIIKSLKIQETSKIITIISEEGLNNFFVKGGGNFRSRNFSYSNELTKIGYDFSKKTNDSLKILTFGMIIDNYSSIKQSFSKLNDCFLILELITHLGNHINDFKTLYKFIDDILKLINEREYSSYYLLIFRLKLLYLLGIGPVFSKCVSCGKNTDLVGFVFEYGGMYCKSCTNDTHQYLSKELTENVKFLYLTKLENFSIDLINSLNFDTGLISKALDKYYEHFLGFKSKARIVIEKMQK